MAKKAKYIFLIGNVGSGKSTAMPILTKALNAKPLHADDLFQTKCPFKDDFLKDKKRWAFTNELWLTRERAKMLQAYDKKNKNKLTLVDSGLLMSWVYTYSHYLEKIITKCEWELYSEIYHELIKDFAKNIIVVNFVYSHPTLFKRIKKRGRDYELAGYRSQYIKQLEKGLKSLIKELKRDKVQIINILEKESPDFEANRGDRDKLIKKIKKELRS